MDLDRQTIEKRDFPIGRRGYEPDAVDAHLEAIAQEVSALRKSARSRSGESLASAASAQVQAIVEAAETSAAEIERQAQLAADRMRQEAERDSQHARDQATAQASERVNEVSQATATMLQRVDAMESELGALFESLRTGANRLTADLSLLEGNMGELHAAAAGRASAPARAVAAPGPAAAESEDLGPEPAGAAETGAAAPAVSPADDSQGAPEPARSGAGSPAEDVEGARLIALNMALDGQPRSEADRYLAENFDLPDREGLLDEVYSAVQG